MDHYGTRDQLRSTLCLRPRPTAAKVSLTNLSTEEHNNVRNEAAEQLPTTLGWKTSMIATSHSRFTIVQSAERIAGKRLYACCETLGWVNLPDGATQSCACLNRQCRF